MDENAIPQTIMTPDEPTTAPAEAQPTDAQTPSRPKPPSSDDLRKQLDQELAQFHITIPPQKTTKRKSLAIYKVKCAALAVEAALNQADTFRVILDDDPDNAMELVAAMLAFAYMLNERSRLS